MASFSEDPTSVHTLPLTAPIEESQSEGLPEEPVVSDSELQRQADLFVKRWQTVPAGASLDQFLLSIGQLRLRLERNLRIWSAGVTTNELTPRLELVESSRMLEAAVPSASEAEQTFYALPQIQMESKGGRPRVLQLARAYLEAVSGIWSQKSLELYVQQIQRHTPLLLKEILALPT